MEHVDELTETAVNNEIKKHVGDIAAKISCVSSCTSNREAIVQLKQAPSNIISLKSVTENQQKWRATSSGYQNFFEFGELQMYSGNLQMLRCIAKVSAAAMHLPHIMHQLASWCYFSWFCHWR
jgi:hypothetical protein